MLRFRKPPRAVACKSNRISRRSSLTLGSENKCFPKNATLTYRQANSCMPGEVTA
jgi:hypothetical protein